VTDRRRASAEVACVSPNGRGYESDHRANLIRYLLDRVELGDWHAVSDAANDLRVLEASVR